MLSKFILLSAIVLLGSFVKPVKTNNVINFKEQKTRAVIFGGVTNIKRVFNYTKDKITILKFDGDLWQTTVWNYPYDIQPNGGILSTDVWVPWATSATEYPMRKLVIVKENRKVLGSIWQEDEYVRFNNKDEYAKGARPIAGESAAGGDRILVITENRGQINITLKKFP